MARILISSLISMLFLWWGYSYISENNISIAMPTPPITAAIAVIFLINTFFRSLFNRFVLVQADVNLSIVESYCLSLTGAMISMTLPGKAGILVRALYLKRTHGLNFGNFAASTAILNLSLLAGSSFVGVIGLIACYYIANTEVSNVLASLSLVFISTIALMLFARTEWRASNRLPAAITRFMNHIATAAKQRNILIFALTCSLLFILLSTISVILLCNGIPTIEAELTGAVVLAAAHNISGIISVTPGNLGIQELFSMLFSESVNILKSDVFIIILTWRVIRITTSILIGIPAALALIFSKNLQTNICFVNNKDT